MILSLLPILADQVSLKSFLRAEHAYLLRGVRHYPRGLFRIELSAQLFNDDSTRIQMNRPFHAFYALKDIPAFTELTIDYNPRYSESKQKGKVNPREDLLEGAIQCLCGEESCRGLIFSYDT